MPADATTPSLDLTAFRYNPEAAKTLMNLWVGASSVLWAPFWAASGAGLSLWMMREGAAKAVPLSDELPPAFRSWMTAHNLWFRSVAPVAEAVEDATEATLDMMTDIPEAAFKVADKTVETAKSQAEVIEPAAEKMTDTVKAAVQETVAEAPAPKVPPVPVPEVAAVAAATPLLKPTKEAASLAVSKTKTPASQAPKLKGPAKPKDSGKKT